MDLLQQILEQQAASLHPSVRDRFQEAFAERSRARGLYSSMAAALQPPPSNVLLTQIEGELATHPYIAEYFGPFYRACGAHQGGDVSDRYLPADWDDTEAAMRDVVEGVINFHAHWRQNHGSSVELFKALLAEIEGFRRLLANFDTVEALCFEPRAGGSAPEAIA